MKHTLSLLNSSPNIRLATKGVIPTPSHSQETLLKPPTSERPSRQLPDVSGGSLGGTVSRDIVHKGRFTEKELESIGAVALLGNRYGIIGLNLENQLVSAIPGISPELASADWNAPLMKAAGPMYFAPRRLQVTDTNAWIAPVLLSRMAAE